MNSLISLSANEHHYTLVIFYLLSSLVLYVFISKGIRWIKHKRPERELLCRLQGINKSHVWLLMSVLLLVFYFKAPDKAVSGGSISVRIQLFFFITLIICLCTQKLPYYIQFIAFLIVLSMDLLLLKQHFSDSAILS